MNSPNHKAKRGVIRPDKTVEVSSFEGIMPDPETLQKLEAILPGCGREWMEMAKSEVAHRHKSENRITWTFKYGTLIGQVLGFLANLIVCGAGAYAIHLGHPGAGATIITGSAAAVVTAFIFRGKNKNQ